MLLRFKFDAKIMLSFDKSRKRIIYLRNLTLLIKSLHYGRQGVEE